MAGCNTTVPPTAPPPAQPPVEAEVEATLPAVDDNRREIEWLLDEAVTAFHDNRLTTPLNDNAYYRYLRVLALDPHNAEAEHGIADIADKYLVWAMDRAANGDYRSATEYLNKAKSVDEGHPNIPAVTNYINDRRGASRFLYRLPPGPLTDRADSVAKDIREIGVAATEHRALCIITARSDAEGRWIYQQLNSATSIRIRGRIEIGETPEIRLVY